MKKIFLIFISSFFLNLIWENLHSFLYAGYMGGKITEFVLMRASLGDAVILAVLSSPFVLIVSLRKRSWLIIPISVLISIFIELYALRAGRWAYNEYMPIIPILGVGLTPTVQLGLLGYLLCRLMVKKPELFMCPECALGYKDKKWAEKCEAWCREHHSCNLEITSHAEK